MNFIFKVFLVKFLGNSYRNSVGIHSNYTKFIATILKEFLIEIDWVKS